MGGVPRSPRGPARQCSHSADCPRLTADTDRGQRARRALIGGGGVVPRLLSLILAQSQSMYGPDWPCAVDDVILTGNELRLSPDPGYCTNGGFCIRRKPIKTCL